MNNFTVSLNPTYYCNFRCDFCYLSKSQLADSLRIKSETLEKLLGEIQCKRKITHIDLYGGEIALMPETDFMQMKATIKKFYDGTINIISNGSVIPPHFLADDIELSISWDFKARAKSKTVLENIRAFPKPVRILTLASRRFLHEYEADPLLFINTLNNCPNVISLEVKPYSKNQNNDQNILYAEFEYLILNMLSFKKHMNYEFINETKIQNSLASVSSSWSDDHIYITPEGSFAVLEFDSKGCEYFKKFHSFTEYELWTQEEKLRVLMNPHCGTCKFTGRCLSEHLQPLTNMQHSCNGFFNLLEKFDSERI